MFGDSLDRLHDNGYRGSWPAVVIRAGACRRCFVPRDFNLLSEVRIQFKFAAWPDHVGVAGIRLHECEITARAAHTSLDGDVPWLLFRRLLSLILIRLRREPGACQQDRKHD